MKTSPIVPVRQPDRIINYWKKEKYICACIIIFGLGYNIAAVLGPIYQGKLLDALLRGDALAGLARLAALYISLIAGVQIMRYIKRFYTRQFANSTAATMRLTIYNHIIHKDYTELTREDSGDLMTRALSDVDLCVEGMRKFTTEIFDTGVLMASYLGAMLLYDVPITVMATLFVPAAMFLAEKLKGIIYAYTTAYRAQSSAVAGMTYEYIENVMLYRVSGVEGQNCARYGQELRDLQNKAVKATILENSMQPIYNVIAMLGVISVIYAGGGKVISGEWTVGVFSAYITMFAALATKASKAAKLFNSVQSSQISWRRIKPYLGEYRSKEAQAVPRQSATRLEVENLSFAYPESPEILLDGLSFQACEGEIIGVTGAVASGKSTLGLALLGLYPYEGSIRIDGRELRDYSPAERSDLIAYQGHDPQLLSDTIYNNIALGRAGDISPVLQDVCFEPDLLVMKDGIDTRVGSGGVRLSGGQQARIALARTLHGRNPVIILDDPFSAVDMQTEAAIIKNLKTRYKGSLIILVSHRLAIFPDIDQIMVMHNDRRVEYGSHRELMESSQIYAQIFNLQQMAGESNE